MSASVCFSPSEQGSYSQPDEKQPPKQKNGPEKNENGIANCVWNLIEKPSDDTKRVSLRVMFETTRQRSATSQHNPIIKNA
jgi:hypothetical protein